MGVHSFAGAGAAASAGRSILMRVESPRTFTALELRAYARRVAKDRVPLRAAAGLSPRLREQIRYGVSLTNRCRHCQLAHETYALHTGARPAELAAVVGGAATAFEPAVWTAILYAQALAANDFEPQPVLEAATRRYFGATETHLVEATALEMTVANRCGNTFDALLRRVHGSPDPGSSLLDELVVSGVFLVGAFTSAVRIAVLRRESPHHVFAALFSRPGAVS